MNTSLRAPALHTTQRTATCGCHPPRMSAPQAARSAHCSRALPTGRGEQHDGAPALSRRSLGLGLVLSAGLASVTLPAQAELQTAPAPPAPTTITTPSGIKLQVVVEGSGAQPKEGDTVLIDYVLRRSNGYFIYSTVEGVSFQPRDLPVGPVAFRLGGDSPLIPGVQELIRGMKQGGKVRALIPPSVGYQNCDVDEPQPPTYATKRQLINHCREPLLFELQLLRVTPRA